MALLGHTKKCSSMCSRFFNITLKRAEQMGLVSVFYLPAKTSGSLSSKQSLLSPHDQFTQHLIAERYYSVIKDEPDSFSRFSKDIDFEIIREKRKKEFKLTGKDVHVNHIIKDIVREKCDEEFAKLEGKELRQLKVIQLEYDFLYSQGYNIKPSDEMTSENWLDAMKMTAGRRRKFYHYLQKLKHARSIEKREKSKKKQEDLVSSTYSSLDDNKIFLRLYSTTEKRWHNHRLSASFKFGLPLVWDCSYSSVMSSKEIRNTATQLLDSYHLNRVDKQMPFHLHFVNCSENNPVFRYMQMYQQNDPHFMATVSEKCFMDLFNPKDLIYLSPDAKSTMRQFDPKAVYVMGGFNDQAFQKPLSYAKARELGIKAMKLPLDKYMEWKIGSKSLTLNQMMMIFQDLKNKKSWPEIFRTSIPKRKAECRF